MPQPGTSPLDPDQLARLLNGLDACPLDFDRQLVETFLWTGFHPATVQRPSHWLVRFREDGRLEYKRPKTQAYVVLPVVPRVRPWLQEFLALMDDSGGIPTRAMQRIVRRKCASLGVEGVTPRGLRHTFGAIVDRKHGLLVAAQWMGCDVRTALRYARQTPTAEEADAMKGGLL
jgi:integrase